MRVIVGAIVLLSLAVTVAVAQPPAQRAAMLKPPQVLSPDELPPIARGSGDDLPLPSTLSSTPVVRPTPPPRYTGSTSPAWLSGVDPNVLPAGGTTSKYATVSPLTPPSTDPGTDERTTTKKIIDRLKGITSTEKQPAPRPPTRQVGQRPPEVPTAESPFRGTGANGAPVFAGPPAYRWYGWGSVTPGANPLAPAGQYPKASANWYALTGATPGAFPVPVANPARIVPGTEPPTYGLAQTVPAPQSMIPVSPSVQAIPTPQLRPQLPPELPQPPVRTEPPKHSPAVGSKFMPAPTVPAGSTASVGTPSPPPVSVPTITPPPIPSIPKPVMDIPPVPPVPPVKPESPVVKEPAPLPAFPTPQPERVVSPGVTVPPLPLPIPVVPGGEQGSSLPVPAIAAPKPLPAIETREQPDGRPADRSAGPTGRSGSPTAPAKPGFMAAPGEPTNVPAIGAPKALPAIETPKTIPAVEPSKIALPTTEPKPLVDPKPLPTSVTTDPPPAVQRWQPATKPATPPPGTWTPAEGVTPPQPSVEQNGSVKVQPVVARGQMGDKTPDPIITLIKQVCQGRADGIEIRWTGTKKLQVCFEIRTAGEAQKLVADISRRPELGPYQIDFCVLVK